MTGRSSWASTALPTPTATLSLSPSVRQRFAARLSGWFMAASPLGVRRLGQPGAADGGTAAAGSSPTAWCRSLGSSVQRGRLFRRLLYSSGIGRDRSGRGIQDCCSGRGATAGDLRPAEPATTGFHDQCPCREGPVPDRRAEAGQRSRALWRGEWSSVSRTRSAISRPCGLGSRRRWCGAPAWPS